MAGSLQPRPRRSTVLLALLAVQLLFGLHYPILKPALAAGLDPGAWAAVRAASAAALLLGSARGLGIPFPQARRDWLGLAGASLLGVVINQICFVVGLRYTTPGQAALINVTSPVAALVLAWLLRLERPSASRACGIAVAAGGIAVLLAGQIQAGWQAGNIYALINAVSFGSFLVVSRPLYRRVHPYAATSVIFGFGALGVLAVVGWRVPLVEWTALPWWAWGAMAYAILGATVGTYALNAFALRHADASVVGFFIFLQPLVATVVSWLAGGEQLDVSFGVAAAFVVLGVALVLRRPPTNTIQSTAAR